jgi:hypothetical protein
MFFFGNIFSKKLKKFIDKFFVRRKVLEILKKTFSKKYFQKNIFFFKEKHCFFFKKTKFFFIGLKIHFFFEKKSFFVKN